MYICCFFSKTALINPVNTHAFVLFWVFCLSDPSNTWCAVVLSFFLSFPWWYRCLRPTLTTSHACPWVSPPSNQLCVPLRSLCSLAMDLQALLEIPDTDVLFLRSPGVALVAVLFVTLSRVGSLALRWAFELKPFVCLWGSQWGLPV